MNLRELLIPGVYDYDVEQLAAVQQRAIKISISGHDADVQAQSGTKKMKTVAIPRLQQLDVKVVDYQVLILTPTQKSVQEHGNMNLMECHAVMRKFRTGYSPILNTADSPTPITEVPQISLIINYDLPSKPENYIHR
ncbi:unnamed protein product [Rotaria sp. Silwood1]|nr:unnamed protein product [Rotaria sp. Silwood1]CAF3830758.1 unnamed protein product [Rotaria sp. Silwood1]